MMLLRVTALMVASHNRRALSTALPRTMKRPYQGMLLFQCTAGVPRARIVPLDGDDGNAAMSSAFPDVNITPAIFGMPSYGDIVVPDAGVNATGSICLVREKKASSILPMIGDHRFMSLAEFQLANGTSFPLCPVNTLRSAAKKAREEFGIEIEAGFEIEFQLLNKESLRPADDSIYCSTKPFHNEKITDTLEDIMAKLQGEDISFTQVHSESAPVTNYFLFFYYYYQPYLSLSIGSV
jgi:hypothetical protein